jgi:hypothetical protein
MQGKKQSNVKKKRKSGAFRWPLGQTLWPASRVLWPLTNSNVALTPLDSVW